MNEDLGIDLGTATVIIYVQGKGNVLREPSMIAVDKNTKEVLAVGKEAKKMLGRVPDNNEIISPLKDGVISNFTLTEKMLKFYIKKVCKNRFVNRRIMICVPSQITEVEKRAVIDVTMESGAKKVYLIEEPVAAAVGAGLDIEKPCGNLVVDIGGGTTDIAVISIKNSVVSSSIKIAGNKFDKTIMKVMKRHFNIIIGEKTAIEIKERIGCVFPRVENISMRVRGRNAETGLPLEIEVTSQDIIQPLYNEAMKIVTEIKDILEKTPPELIEDISQRGIYLTGGGSLLYGMDKLIQKYTGIKVMIAEDAVSCVALGTGKALNNLDLIDLKNRKKGI